MIRSRATVLAVTLSGVLAGVVATGSAGTPASADPGPAEPDQVAAETEDPSAAAVVTEPAGAVGPVTDACRQFTVALSVAATNYEDFAYATAGSGDFVDYQDPNVSRTNVVGRTALREAAAAAMSASRTPGLPPEVSDPMQSWSLHATKLVLIMGLRGGGDSLNAAATQLNADASTAQMACAQFGATA